MEFTKGMLDRTKDIIGCKTQLELAEHFGVTRKQVSAWRNGHATPPYPKFIKIAKDNNLNLNWFFLGIGEKYLSRSDIKQITREDLVSQDELPFQEKEIILTIMNYMPYTPPAFFKKVINKLEEYKKTLHKNEL